MNNKNNENNFEQDNAYTGKDKEKLMIKSSRKSAKPNLNIKIKKKKKKKSMLNPTQFKENEGNDLNKEENIKNIRQSGRPFGDIKFGSTNKKVNNDANNININEQTKNNGTTRRELLIDKKFLK